MDQYIRYHKKPYAKYLDVQSFNAKYGTNIKEVEDFDLYFKYVFTEARRKQGPDDFLMANFAHQDEFEEMGLGDWLKNKADKGADYFITQMFFDCSSYEKFLDKATKKGINQPIIPGIKPLTTYRHLEALAKIFACKMPKQLRDRMERVKDSKKDIRKVGIEWCIEQCIRLREMGAPSLHFYASRKAPIKEIIEAINSHKKSQKVAQQFN
mgnify:CR=1 FL=1